MWNAFFQSLVIVVVIFFFFFESYTRATLVIVETTQVNYRYAYILHIYGVVVPLEFCFLVFFLRK